MQHADSENLRSATCHSFFSPFLCINSIVGEICGAPRKKEGDREREGYLLLPVTSQKGLQRERENVH